MFKCLKIHFILVRVASPKVVVFCMQFKFSLFSFGGCENQSCCFIKTESCTGFQSWQNTVKCLSKSGEACVC